MTEHLYEFTGRWGRRLIDSVPEDRTARTLTDETEETFHRSAPMPDGRKEVRCRFVKEIVLPILGEEGVDDLYREHLANEPSQVREPFRRDADDLAKDEDSEAQFGFVIHWVTSWLFRNESPIPDEEDLRREWALSAVRPPWENFQDDDVAVARFFRYLGIVEYEHEDVVRLNTLLAKDQYAEAQDLERELDLKFVRIQATRCSCGWFIDYGMLVPVTEAVPCPKCAGTGSGTT